jgi:hypothetical protein
LFRQPGSSFELRQVLRAAEVNVTNAYGVDGNLNWKPGDIVLWWRTVRDLRAKLRGNVDKWSKTVTPAAGHPSVDRPSESLCRWLAFIEDGAELYLREYY